MQVESAGTNAPRVVRQANDAVAVLTLQIGFGHQRRDGGGVIIRHARRRRPADEIAQAVSVDARRRRS
jgi:hypothetical protein